jgi:hypothetical protein
MKTNTTGLIRQNWEDLMPWVRGHYARRSRTRRYNRSSGLSVGAIVVVLIGVLLVIYLLTR